MNIEGNFEATLWRHRWRHHHEILFLHNLGRSFHIWGKIVAVLNIKKFQNGRHFQVATTFLPDVIPEVEYTSKIAMSISDILSFWSTLKLDGDISISKFDLLCDLVTSSMTPWIRVYKNVIVISWYLCTGSLIIISLLVFYLKMLFHFQMNIEGRLLSPPWRHRWRHHYEKYFLWHNLFISEVTLKLCLIFQDFQNGRHFELATFSAEVIQYFELLIDALAQILTEIYQFQYLTYFVT